MPFWGIWGMRTWDDHLKWPLRSVSSPGSLLWVSPQDPFTRILYSSPHHADEDLPLNLNSVPSHRLISRWRPRASSRASPEIPPLRPPCLSLLSCLPWLSASPVWPSATSLPFLPHALPRSHSSLLGWGARGDGPLGLAMQNANQALGGTSHDFPPRRELLFCHWFHYNRTVPVTFLPSGGRSAALTAAEGPPVMWPFSHSGRIFFFVFCKTKEMTTFERSTVWLLFTRIYPI